MLNETLRSVLVGRCAPFTSAEMDEMSDQTALNWLNGHRQEVNQKKIWANFSLATFYLIINLLLYSLFLSTIFKLNIQIEMQILIIVIVSFLLLNFNDILNKFGLLENKLTQLEYFARVMYISIETQRLKPENKEAAKDLLLIDLESEAFLREGEKLIEEYSTPFWLKYPTLIWLTGLILFTWFLLHNWQYLTKLFN